MYFYNHWWKIQLYVAIQFIISTKCDFFFDDLDSSVEHGVIDANIRRRHERDFDLWLLLTTAYTRVYFILHKTLKSCIIQNLFPFWRSYSTAATSKIESIRFYFFPTQFMLLLVLKPARSSVYL